MVACLSRFSEIVKPCFMNVNKLEPVIKVERKKFTSGVQEVFCRK
jgi:hypothetical protein